MICETEQVVNPPCGGASRIPAGLFLLLAGMRLSPARAALAGGPMRLILYNLCPRHLYAWISKEASKAVFSLQDADQDFIRICDNLRKSALKRNLAHLISVSLAPHPSRSKCSSGNTHNMLPVAGLVGCQFASRTYPVTYAAPPLSGTSLAQGAGAPLNMSA